MYSWILAVLCIKALIWKGSHGSAADNTDSTTQENPEDGKLEVWQLAVICAAAAIVLAIIITILVCLIRKCRKPKKRYAENLDMALRLEDPIDPYSASNGSLGGLPKMSHMDTSKGQGLFGTSNFRPAFATNVQSIVSAAMGPHGGVNPAFTNEEEMADTTEGNEISRAQKYKTVGRTTTYVDNDDDFRAGREDTYEKYLQDNQTQSRSDSEPTVDTKTTSDTNAVERPNIENETEQKDDVRSTTAGSDVYSRDEHFLY